MRAREVRREYLALVEGHPDAEAGTIDAPIGRDRARRTVVSTRSDRPREAVTRFEVIERLPATTLLRVTLETGRTHQIRAHLAAIGHPVCGDPQYGGRASGTRLGLTRQFLHARRLMFSHPRTREPVVCESKPPVDLRRALDAARRDQSPEGQTGTDIQSEAAFSRLALFQGSILSTATQLRARRNRRPRPCPGRLHRVREPAGGSNAQTTRETLWPRK